MIKFKKKIIFFLRPTCQTWWWPFRCRVCGTFPTDPCPPAWPWDRRPRRHPRAWPRNGVARPPDVDGVRRARRPRPTRASLRRGSYRHPDDAERDASLAWVSWFPDNRRPWRTPRPLRPTDRAAVEAAAGTAVAGHRPAAAPRTAARRHCCCCCSSAASWRKSRWTTHGPPCTMCPVNVGHRS